MSEEMAREIGIAYWFYSNRCKEEGKIKKDLPDFIKEVTDSIEDVRLSVGLKNENDICG